MALGDGLRACALFIANERARREIAEQASRRLIGGLLTESLLIDRLSADALIARLADPLAAADPG